MPSNVAFYSACHLRSSHIIGFGILIASLVVIYITVLGINASFLILESVCLLYLFFKLLVFVKGHRAQTNYQANENTNDLDLPVYSILVPVYKEEYIIEQLVNSIRKLDYPKNKLDVIIILEQDDTATLDKLHTLNCEEYFNILVIPDSFPRTKPKACNYALSFAKGEYLTIYDAEDIPDPKQLRMAHSYFTSNPNIMCVQAQLNFYNGEHNLITKLFAIEYGILFKFVIKGLHQLNLPIPLGGTSNHFRTKDLRTTGAWDSYNVTEDAELGMRIYSQNLVIATIESVTMEGSVTNIKAWFKQRARWTKGYMQTAASVLLNYSIIRTNIGISGMLKILLVIALPVLLQLVILPATLFLIILSYYGYIAHEVILFSSLTSSLYYIVHVWMIINTVHNIKHDAYLAVMIYPLFYYLLLPLVSIISLYQLYTDPYYWSKTNHSRLSKL